MWSTADAGIDVVCTNISSGSSRGKPRRQIVREKGHKTGYTLVQAVQDVLRGIGRSWAVLAGLDRIHFIDKGRSGTEVTAKLLAEDKGHTRQKGNRIRGEMGR